MSSLSPVIQTHTVTNCDRIVDISDCPLVETVMTICELDIANCDIKFVKT